MSWKEALPVVISERGLPRFAPPRPNDAEPLPKDVLFVATQREHTHGGAAIAGRYTLRGAGGERAEGWFAGPAARQGFHVPGSNGSLLTLDEFLDRRFFHTCYKPPRAVLVGYDLAGAIAGLSRPFLDSRGEDRLYTIREDRIRFYLWLHTDSAGRPRRNGFRPPIEARPRGHGAALYAFGRRRDPDPKDLLSPLDRPGEPRGRRSTKELLEAGWRHPRGRFFDLRTASYVVSGEESLTLRQACRLFGIDAPPAEELVEALPERISAMEKLHDALLAEFSLWPGAPYLSPDRALTPSSLPKAIFRAAGIPIGARGPRRALAAAMACAGVGAHSEVRGRRVSAPVAYADGHSLYPAVSSIIRAQDICTHEVRVRHVTSPRRLMKLRALLAYCAVDALLSNPSLWPRLRFVVLVRPPAYLPIRAHFSARGLSTATTWLVEGSEPVWATGFDVALSTVKSGRVPELLEAWVWEAGEPLPGLRPVTGLLGGWTFDPTGTLHGPGVRHDLGQLLAEARMLLKEDVAVPAHEQAGRRGCLRVAANAVVYGVPVEFTSGGKARSFTVDTARGPVQAIDARPEHPGPYFNPAVGAFVVGAARLLLGLMLHLIEQAGGSWQWCDTDGFTATTKAGERGRSNALSWPELWAILARFEKLAEASGLPIPDERLVPTTEDDGFEVVRGGPGAVPSLFKLEPQNFLPGSKRIDPRLRSFAISQKRYTLFYTDEQGRLAPDPRAKPSRHGLGNILNPSGLSDREFAEACWRHLIDLVGG